MDDKNLRSAGLVRSLAMVNKASGALRQTCSSLDHIIAVRIGIADIRLVWGLVGHPTAAHCEDKVKAKEGNKIRSLAMRNFNESLVLWNPSLSMAMRNSR